MKVQISSAEMPDLPAWLGLASEVVPWFDAISGFDTILERKIQQKQAYCAIVKEEGLNLAGGILLGGSGNEHWIRWRGII